MYKNTKDKTFKKHYKQIERITLRPEYVNVAKPVYLTMSIFFA